MREQEEEEESKWSGWSRKRGAGKRSGCEQ